jgi:flagellar biosynthesis GTPase FlhF
MTSDIEALFALPLAEFTAARNALASALRKQKRTAEAAEVKALPKPSATAWAVNQLFWQYPRDFERLFELGAKVRDASGAPGTLRALLEERRALLSEMTSRAATLLHGAGHASSLDALRRMTITLETLSSIGRTGNGPLPGRLTVDLEPLGFDDLAALLLVQEPPQGKVLPFGHEAREKKAAESKAADAAKAERKAAEEKAAERKAAEALAAARARAKQAVKDAEQSLKSARQRAQRTEAALLEASKHAAALEAQKRDLEEQLNQALEARSAAAEEAVRAARAIEEAEQTLARARATLSGG